MPTNRRDTNPKIDSLKRFNKVQLFQTIGLISRKFNYQTLEFEKSWLLRLVFYLSLISKPLCITRPLISYYFPRNDRIQLVIGSVFNYIDGDARYFLGIGVSVQELQQSCINEKLNFKRLPSPQSGTLALSIRQYL